MRNLGELKEAIAAWTNRRDLTAQIPGFIQLAEADIFRTLRCIDNEFVAIYDSGVESGVVPADPTAFATLPFNFLEMRAVFWRGRPLREISPSALKAMRANGHHVSRETSYFCRFGRRIDFWPELPASQLDWEDADQLEYHYYGSENLTGRVVDWGAELNPGFPTNPVTTNGDAAQPIVTEQGQPDQDDTNSTRLLQKQPNLYLYGALHHALDFLRKHDEAQMWLTKWSQVMQAIESATAEGEFSGSPSYMDQPYPDQGTGYRL